MAETIAERMKREFMEKLDLKGKEIANQLQAKALQAIREDLTGAVWAAVQTVLAETLMNITISDTAETSKVEVVLGKPATEPAPIESAPIVADPPVVEPVNPS